MASARVVTGIHITHQGSYLPEILLVVQQSLVNTSRTRSMVQGRSKKGLFDKPIDDGSLRKSISKQKRGAENVKRVLDDNADQGTLHGEHHPVRL